MRKRDLGWCPCCSQKPRQSRCGLCDPGDEGWWAAGCQHEELSESLHRCWGAFGMVVTVLALIMELVLVYLYMCFSPTPWAVWSNTICLLDFCLCILPLPSPLWPNMQRMFPVIFDPMFPVIFDLKEAVLSLLAIGRRPLLPLFAVP